MTLFDFINESPWWTEQLCGETFAKWVKPTPERMIHIGGNHYMLDTSKLKNEPPKGRG